MSVSSTRETPPLPPRRYASKFLKEKKPEPPKPLPPPGLPPNAGSGRRFRASVSTPTSPLSTSPQDGGSFFPPPFKNNKRILPRTKSSPYPRTDPTNQSTTSQRKSDTDRRTQSTAQAKIHKSPLRKAHSQTSDNHRSRIKFKDGTNYHGEHISRIPHGTGKLIYPNGDVYEGKVQNGLPHGEGTFYFTNEGTTYIGEMKNGLPDGKGKMEYGNGDIYQGKIRNGRPDGEGILYFKNGSYNGEWKNGVYDGIGILEEGDQKNQGIWQNGKLRKRVNNELTEIKEVEEEVEEHWFELPPNEFT